MIRYFVILFFLILFSSCDRSLTKTRHYVGTSKDILELHIGAAHMEIDNGEKGEILVYFFNQRNLVIAPNGNSAFRPQFADVDNSFIQDMTTYNYAVFLIDLENRVYHTSKKFYNMTPIQLKRKLLEQYG